MIHSPFFTFASAVCALTAGVFLLISAKQPKPYLDEIFHVPQAQKYCQSRFYEWDPKITTLPGLYLTSFAVLKIFARFANLEMEVACSALFLRLTNFVFFVCNVWLLRKLLVAIHAGDRLKKNATSNDHFTLLCSLTALVLAAFPLLYFYTFLYYTDPGSTFLVLLLYYLSLRDNHMAAALAGCIAILFRQTNVVWVVFTAGTTAARKLESAVRQKHAGTPGAVAEVCEYVRCFFVNLSEMLRYLWAYALVVLGFCLFVVINGGIVVGDKSSHEACLNFPQIFYFVGFTLFFSVSHLALPKDIYSFLTSLKKALKTPVYLVGGVLSILLMVALIYKFTYVHEYLLADNRHYPFYLWRKVYARHWAVRYALIPVYAYASWGICHLLSSKQSIFWQLVYFVCIAAVTVPQKLLEFRYFIMPYLLFRLHVPLASLWRTLLELILYFAVNAVTIYLFLEKPFFWPHSPDELQRFMW